MPSAQAIGTGAVVLTTNADQMSAGLDKARADVHRWAQQTEAAGRRATEGLGEKSFEKLTHGFDRKINHLIAGAWIGPLVGGIHAAVEGIFELASGAEEFAEAMAKGRRLAEESVAAFKETANAPLGKDLSALNEGLEQAEKNIRGLQSAHQAAENAAEGHGMSEFFSPEVMKVVAKIPIFGEGLKDSFAAAKDHSEEIAKRLKIAEDAAKKVREQIRDAKFPQYTEASRKGFESLMDRLREEQFRIGKTRGELAEYEAKKLHRPEAEVASARTAGEAVDESEKYQRLKEDAEGFTKSLELQARTFGMTSDEAHLFKLRLDGADEAMIADAQKWMGALEGVKRAFAELEPARAAGAYDVHSTQGYSIQARHTIEGLTGPANDTARKQLQETVRLRALMEKVADKLPNLQFGSV